MTHPKREEEEHSLQWSVHFDIDMSLRQMRRKRAQTHKSNTKLLYNHYYPPKLLFPLNSGFKQNYETELMVYNMKHHIALYYSLSQYNDSLKKKNVVKSILVYIHNLLIRYREFSATKISCKHKPETSLWW